MQPNAFTYSAVAKACLAAGEWSRALRVLEDMVAKGRGTMDVVCCSIAMSFCSC